MEEAELRELNSSYKAMSFQRFATSLKPQRNADCLMFQPV